MSKKEKAQTKVATVENVTVLTSEAIGLALQKKRASLKEFAVWIRALLQNWRQGTVGCKGRSDVARSNKKPWKQKGTGRARAGTARSPLWRGGGVTFGPQARVRSLNVPKQQRKRVLSTLVADFVKNSKLVSVDWILDTERPKVLAAHSMLKASGLHDKKVMVLVKKDDLAIHQSFTNIPNVRLSYFDQMNAFSIASSDYILIFKKDLSDFKQVVEQWS